MVVTQEEIDQVKKHEAHRQNIKQQYRIAYQNPFNYKYVIADPAIARYEAARAYTKEYYKYTPRSLVAPAITIASLIGITFYAYYERKNNLESIQRGDTTYADRALYKTKFLF